MGVMTFGLLVIIFLMLTAGTTSTIIFMKNAGKDTMKILQIAEDNVYHQLKHSQLKQYGVHD